MGDVLEDGALDRWQREPSAFIAEVMRDPESGWPFDLLPAEMRFLDHRFRTNMRAGFATRSRCTACPAARRGRQKAAPRKEKPRGRGAGTRAERSSGRSPMGVI